ncbi:MAG TPA: mycofactocin-coupled SDR family oxidoreductase [Ilumatobacteraceae bacterium]|nr:mycofactocin-coupled SDR family oxidoreductase [Ilumatobacteraceae bacterium]
MGMGRVEGKVALITGAARGQGRSHAIRLAEEGADIIAVDLCAPIETAHYELATADDLAETVEHVKALDRRIIAAEADVRDTAALRAVVEQAVADLGRLDIVVANAGIFSFGPALELTDEAWQDVIDVNLTGAWRTCVASAPSMIAAGNGGSIILTSSAAGLMPFRNTAHYVASKFGVIGLMKCLALELADHMIRVNSVNPTTVETPMVINDPTIKLFLPESDRPTREEFAAVMQESHALPVPWVESRDVSNAVLYLASDEARYVTGVALPVDAGLLIK